MVDNPSMGGDPAISTHKFSMAYYRLGNDSPCLRQRLAAEGQYLKFGTDIQKVIYGNKVITDSTVYGNAYWAFAANQPFTVNNDSMRGDPSRGLVKAATVIYYRDGQQKTEIVMEGGAFKWNA